MTELPREPPPRDPALDPARALVANRDLTGVAVGALTDIARNLPLESLGPVKQLLKRFFSGEPWTAHDDDALAALLGADSGAGSGELALDPELTLVWGWLDGRFLLRLRYTGTGAAVADDARDESDLESTFASDVFPEVTPSPRTIRFTTPPLHSGASQVYDSRGAAAADARVARVFEEFASVTNVLVGPDFVAVTIARPHDWETLLGPMLRAVAEEFTGATSSAIAPTPAASDTAPATDTADTSSEREPRRLERAWAELGSLRADRAADLDRILAATRDPEAARRQVAAALLADAPPAVAAAGWEQLLDDSSRGVRRSTIDAVVDAAREELRPLLERALADPDAWIRWKAVRGIAAIGASASRAAIDARADDPDFRVRLEAGRARR